MATFIKFQYTENKPPSSTDYNVQNYKALETVGIQSKGDLYLRLIMYLSDKNLARIPFDTLAEKVLMISGTSVRS